MSPFRAAFVATLALFCTSAAIAGVTARDAKALTGRVIVLTQNDIAHLGLLVQPLKPARYTPRVHGYGVVSDLTALAAADAAVETAQAAARQSQADVQRARALFAQGGAVSKQSVDAAEKQAATDQAALLLARRQEVVQFGPQLPWRGKHAEASILRELTSGDVALVRATFPLDSITAAQPQEISVTHLSAQQDPIGWTSKRIWSAPADPTIPGRSFFVLIAKSDLQSGEHVLVASPTGPTVDGVEIPSDAVVLSEEKTWCYLQIAPGQFQRVQIDLSHPRGSGYFVKAKPGLSVVVRGSGLLLARELGASALHY
ncbi:MAG TPA: hypothetical protein VIM56_05820 [Rhizomicrobium sp.]